MRNVEVSHTWRTYSCNTKYPVYVCFGAQYGCWCHSSRSLRHIFLKVLPVYATLANQEGYFCRGQHQGWHRQSWSQPLNGQQAGFKGSTVQVCQTFLGACLHRGPASSVDDFDISIQDVSMVRGSSCDEEQGADAVQHLAHVAADQGL